MTPLARRLLAGLTTTTALLAYAGTASATANHLAGTWDGARLAGSNAVAGATVTVTSPHGAGTLCSVVASAAGAFSCSITQAQAGGDKILHVRQTSHAETVVVHLRGENGDDSADDQSDDNESDDNESADNGGDNESNDNESNDHGSDDHDNDHHYTITQAHHLNSNATCPATLNEDRAGAQNTVARTFDRETKIYSSKFGNNAAKWQALSGTWKVKDGAYSQTDHCGFDYTSILAGGVPAVADFRYSVRFHAVEGTNQGGIVFDQSSPGTRSLATIVDLAEGGTVVRWGHYNQAGYYVNEGSAPIAAAGTHAVTLTVESHGASASIAVNGTTVGTVTNAHPAGGYVGLVATQSEIAFESVTLTGLPARS